MVVALVLQVCLNERTHPTVLRGESAAVTGWLVAGAYSDIAVDTVVVIGLRLLCWQTWLQPEQTAVGKRDVEISQRHETRRSQAKVWT